MRETIAWIVKNANKIAHALARAILFVRHHFHSKTYNNQLDYCKTITVKH